MKKVILIASVSLFFTACNMNPSKEARLQELETEMLKAMDKIGKLESRIQILEDMNGELNAKMLELEKTNTNEK